MSKKLLKAVLTNQAGFTLIEILIALTLIAIMGTFVTGKIFEQLKEGRISATTIQMNNLSERLMEFRRHCHNYPTTDQGLDALISKPTVGKECKRYAPNGYIDGNQVPLDPWDNEYVYESDGSSFTLFSLGPDGEEGTEDDVFHRKNSKEPQE